MTHKNKVFKVVYIYDIRVLKRYGTNQGQTLRH